MPACNHAAADHLDQERRAVQALRRGLRRDVAAFHSDIRGERARQNDAVTRAVGSLRAGESALRVDTPHEMLLLDLYEALSSLNELTGEITTEDILGRIFSTFCIGK